MKTSTQTPRSRSRIAQRCLEAAALTAVCSLSAYSAFLMKRADTTPPPAAQISTASLNQQQKPAAQPAPEIVMGNAQQASQPAADAPAANTSANTSQGNTNAQRVELIADDDPIASQIRYFDGRSVKPVRRLWMTVTAYSPDERSCGIHADGITASTKSVWTNAMQLVAADTRLLPFGSLLSLDEYADGNIVPVLDRGGAIKGMRLDVLYATHNEAIQFGVKHVPVTVWEYADE